MRIFQIRKKILVAGALSVVSVLAYIQLWSRPRVWAANEVPVAFWAWRGHAPDGSDIQKAIEATNVKVLFLRAGQFDVVNGTIQRIRPVSGTLPDSPELHLVYNGTRNFLVSCDKLDTAVIAQAVADTFKSDVSGAALNGSQISGLQLDLDIPDRFLPKYAEVLEKLHGLIPRETKLSITGLPGWAFMADVKPVLDQVDFWVPQCYGSKIPANIDQRIPISSSTEVERIISRVRQLKKPFYAGLSAYSYAILYAKDGSLAELRGDLDPALAAENSNLDLVDTQQSNIDEGSSEVRYVYRAKQDVVLDSLIIRTGEMLVFDLPTAGSLRDSIRAARENAGESLLGICLFRLPSTEDKTTLGLGEIAAALADQQTRPATSVKLEKDADQQIKLIAENTGSARSIIGDGAADYRIAACRRAP